MENRARFVAATRSGGGDQRGRGAESVAITRGSLRGGDPLDVLDLENHVRVRLHRRVALRAPPEVRGDDQLTAAAWQHANRALLESGDDAIDGCVAEQDSDRRRRRPVLR